MANQDQWLLARGERDGFPMIVRMAAAYRGMGALPGYDHHIIIAATLRSPTPAGFPSVEEGVDLQRFEKNLCSAIETDNESLCVLVITNRGIRDFVFYTRNPQGVKVKMDEALPALEGFEFNVAIKPDKDWQIYRAFDNWLIPPSKPNGLAS
jgi:Family of unknown function (DUF695)